MSERIRIFISRTSDDFARLSVRLTDELRQWGFDVSSMDAHEFNAGNSMDLRGKLECKIRAANLMIALVGWSYGADAATHLSGVLEGSITMFETRFAKEEAGIPIVAFVTPDQRARAGADAVDAQRHDLLKAHRAWLSETCVLTSIENTTDSLERDANLITDHVFYEAKRLGLFIGSIERRFRLPARPSYRLVGRDLELARLNELLARKSAICVAVRGVISSGKSALVHAVLTRRECLARFEMALHIDLANVRTSFRELLRLARSALNPSFDVLEEQPADEFLHESVLDLTDHSALLWIDGVDTWADGDRDRSDLLTFVERAGQRVSASKIVMTMRRSAGLEPLDTIEWIPVAALAPEGLSPLSIDAAREMFAHALARHGVGERPANEDELLRSVDCIPGFIECLAAVVAQEEANRLSPDSAPVRVSNHIHARSQMLDRLVDQIRRDATAWDLFRSLAVLPARIERDRLLNVLGLTERNNQSMLAFERDLATLQQLRVVSLRGGVVECLSVLRAHVEDHAWQDRKFCTALGKKLWKKLCSAADSPTGSLDCDVSLRLAAECFSRGARPALLLETLAARSEHGTFADHLIRSGAAQTVITWTTTRAKDRVIRARLTRIRAAALRSMGENERACAALEEVLPVLLDASRGRTVALPIADCLLEYALALGAERRHRDARSTLLLVERMLNRQDRDAEARLLANAKHALANTWLELGYPTRSLELLRESREIANSAADPQHPRQTQLDDAMRQMLVVWCELERLPSHRPLDKNAAGVLTRILETAELRLRQTTSSLHIARLVWCRWMRARIEWSAQAHKAAWTLLDQAESQFRRLRSDRGLDQHRYLLGWIHRSRAEFSAAVHPDSGKQVQEAALEDARNSVAVFTSLTDHGAGTRWRKELGIAHAVLWSVARDRSPSEAEAARGDSHRILLSEFEQGCSSALPVLVRRGGQWLSHAATRSRAEVIDDLEAILARVQQEAMTHGCTESLALAIDDTVAMIGQSCPDVLESPTCQAILAKLTAARLRYHSPHGTEKP